MENPISTQIEKYEPQDPEEVISFVPDKETDPDVKTRVSGILAAIGIAAYIIGSEFLIKK